MLKIQKKEISCCILVIVFLAFISGCAGLDKDDCQQGDWFGIGYEDGANGYPATQIGKHRKACSKYGVKPDYQEYESGRNKGLEEYCTPQNGYRIGEKGFRYHAVCPDNMGNSFLNAYYQGNAVYQIKKDNRTFQRKIKVFETAIQRNKAKISAREKDLVKDGIKSTERKKILADIRLIEEDIKINRAQKRHYVNKVRKNKVDLYRIESHMRLD